MVKVNFLYVLLACLSVSTIYSNYKLVVIENDYKTRDLAIVESVTKAFEKMDKAIIERLKKN